jgi:integrase
MITMTARRHRGRGKGSVYEDRARGRWVAAVSLEPEPGTRRRPRRKQSAATQAEAEALLRKMMAELDETGTITAKNYTVGQAIADYMSHPPSTWKTASTLSVNQTHAAHLTAALGPALLNRLTVQQVEDHLAAEGRRGLSRSAVDGQRFLLRLVIKRAQKTDLVNRNVADLADLPAGLPVRKSRSMTEAQMDALLNLDYTRWDASSGGTGHLAGAYWRAWLACALLLGLRPGEIGALRWDDLTGGVLQVRHGLQRTGDGNGLAVANLKTAGSRRAMEIPDDAAGPLAAWRKVQASQRLAAGAAWTDLGLVFTDETGQPVGRQRTHRGFRAVCEAAGIGRWQPRECRHTFVSVMDEQGADIEEISDAVGHVNSTVTKKVYRHQLSPVISGVARRMNDRKRGAS